MMFLLISWEIMIDTETSDSAISSAHQNITTKNVHEPPRVTLQNYANITIISIINNLIQITSRLNGMSFYVVLPLYKYKRYITNNTYYLKTFLYPDKYFCARIPYDYHDADTITPSL